MVLINVDRPGLAEALATRGLIATCANAVPVAHGAAAAIIDDRTASARWSDVDGWGIPLLHLIDGDEDALVAALDGGADDALSAQSSDALIAARIAAIVRRGMASRWVRIGDLSIDTLERTVSRAGRAIPLLPREYRLLLVLARAPGQTVSRQTLVAALCGLRFDPIRAPTSSKSICHACAPSSIGDLRCRCSTPNAGRAIGWPRRMRHHTT